MYSINEVEKMFGLPASTLRFYEKKGLLPQINRDTGGRRKYTQPELEWLQLVIALRNTGMTIDEIKAYVVLIQDESVSLEERRAFLFAHKQSVEAKMAQMFSNLEKINRKVAIYDAMIHERDGGKFLI
ncbi:MerR family transcriptional regulator [Exiguobacterium sp. BMC-KP]|uniref:MerR family transcriptional regulator n=1 Tax=Exiguobacterium sp. BMC-KP TaxID=1684312 RepID=UPI0006AA3D7A|nr:MerR family transcriptional regulator [Exiguobacterium sp. BMC-KP]KOP29313.1 MerR family transcriptional regulator [Exiguobacterium sp. BMC-KP]